jgi:hypothetical protein
MGGACSAHGVGDKCVQILVGKPKVKRPLERNMRRWKDNIKIDVKKMGQKCVDWINLAQDKTR